MLALLRIGFSLAEVRGMTMRDFIAYTDLAFEKQDGSGVREATQDDIDRFLA